MKTKRKVYRGWMDVKDVWELPKELYPDINKIVFGLRRWRDDNTDEKKVKITVEWKEK